MSAWTRTWRMRLGSCEVPIGRLEAETGRGGEVHFGYVRGRHAQLELVDPSGGTYPIPLSTTTLKPGGSCTIDFRITMQRQPHVYREEDPGGYLSWLRRAIASLDLYQSKEEAP